MMKDCKHNYRFLEEHLTSMSATYKYLTFYCTHCLNLQAIRKRQGWYIAEENNYEKH